jgi:hypothetical protein
MADFECLIKKYKNEILYIMHGSFGGTCFVAVQCYSTSVGPLFWFPLQISLDSVLPGNLDFSLFPLCLEFTQTKDCASTQTSEPQGTQKELLWSIAIFVTLTTKWVLGPSLFSRWHREVLQQGEGPFHTLRNAAFCCLLECSLWEKLDPC